METVEGPRISGESSDGPRIRGESSAGPRMSGESPEGPGPRNSGASDAPRSPGDASEPPATGESSSSARGGGGGADPHPPAADDPISEVLLGWAIAVAGAWASFRLLPEFAAPFGNAAAWALVPVALHVRAGRSLEAEGIAWKSPRRTLAATFVCAAVVLPLFSAGFLAWFGARDWRWPGALIFIFTFIGQLFFAAIPEECFFRGFVQPRLGALFPGERPRRILLLPLTRGVVLGAALFALTHVAFEANPVSLAGAGRLLTFFPGLVFGALRQATGDIVAPALFHALCNATLVTLQRGYVH